MGIDGDLEWPSKEQTVVFRGHKILLRPETDELARSLVLELDAKLTQLEARRLLQEFLSGLAWARRGGVLETHSMFCSAAPVGIGKSKGRVISDAPMEYVPDPSSNKARLALALYREAASVNVISYRFLGFYKVINVLYGTQVSQVNWIEQTVNIITEQRAIDRIRELQMSHGDLAKYLYVSGRCAVAHAYSEPVVNPDAPEDIERLARDLPVIRALAELAIEQELGVKSHYTVLHEHLYELEGFRDLLGEGVTGRLKMDGTVSSDELHIPSHLSLRLQGQERLESFEAMLPSLRCIGEGTIELQLQTADQRLTTILHLCFKRERLIFDATCGLGVCDDGSVEAAERLLDARVFFRHWVANGITEVWDSCSDRRLGRTEPAMLVNALPDFDAMKRSIAEAKATIADRKKILREF